MSSCIMWVSGVNMVLGMTLSMGLLLMFLGSELMEVVMAEMTLFVFGSVFLASILSKMLLVEQRSIRGVTRNFADKSKKKVKIS